MKNEFEELMENYFKWLKDKTILKKIDSSEWTEITTPHLDRHNDCLQFYVCKKGNNYLFSDGGYILDDLASSGCVFETKHRKDILRTALAGFGVRAEDNTLMARTTSANFPLKKHNFLQAMLAVNDMFYMTQSHIQSFFLEDVVAWLDKIDVRYVSNSKFEGKSGFDHNFDFIIPKSKKETQRIIQTISSPKRSSVENLMFKWQDTMECRLPDTKFIALVNDTEKNISTQFSEAFDKYNIALIPWSERDDFIDLLAS